MHGSLVLLLRRTTNPLQSFPWTGWASFSVDHHQPIVVLCIRMTAFRRALVPIPSEDRVERKAALSYRMVTAKVTLGL